MAAPGSTALVQSSTVPAMPPWVVDWPFAIMPARPNTAAAPQAESLCETRILNNIWFLLKVCCDVVLRFTLRPDILSGAATISQERSPRGVIEKLPCLLRKQDIWRLLLASMIMNVFTL